jgi:hypothetical protein
MMGSEVNMSAERSDFKTEIIAESDNYQVWRVEEPDGEITYHLEMGNVTVHFFTEEWEEFLALIRSLKR